MRTTGATVPKRRVVRLEKMRDPDARRYLLGIARSFDLLAERAQKGAAPENEVLA
jgi:hypothetical protein